MNSPGRPEIERLYCQAAALSPAERAAFLDSSCAGKAKLRREIERLLDEDRLSGVPLEAEILPRGEPRFIGQYRILGVLGESGIGTVYQAEQQTPPRVLALRVIRTGKLAAAVLRRLEQESEVFVQLQHPGIARMYGAGASGAEAYFAMEFIDGTPLKAYAHAQSLDTRERLDLMAKVCDAVNHAHQRGVLHRDLKPGSILVDRIGQPKVIGFGVARLLNCDIHSAAHPATGQSIGTPDYRSPEQALGNLEEIDVRSDVYSLGVVLYELLAGKLPYGGQKNAPSEMARVIQQEDPEPLNRSFGRDVRTIVEKALEKEKDRRYGSAAELASDIRRHLSQEPIAARRASHAGKFVRNNRGFAGLAAALSLLVLGFAGSMAMLAQRYAKERDNAQMSQARAEQVSGFLADLFRSLGDPATEQGRTLTARDLLDTGAADLSKKLGTQPAARVDLLTVMGSAYQRLGALDRAEAMFGAKIADSERVFGSGSLQVAQAYRERGDIRRYRNELPEAEADLRLAVGILEKLPAGNESDMANALDSQGMVLQAQGRIEEATQLFERGVAVARKASKSTGGELNILANWGGALMDLGQFAKAEQLMREVLDGRRKLFSDSHPLVARSMSRLGRLLTLRAEYVEAEKMAVAGLAGLHQSLGPEHPDVAAADNVLGLLYLETGRAKEAEASFRTALRIAERTLGSEHPESALYQANVGVVLMENGDLSAAEPLFRDSLEVCRKAAMPTRNTASVLLALGRLLVAKGDTDEAERVLTEALTLRQAQRGKAHPATAEVLVRQAELRVLQRRYDEAVSLSREALSTARQLLPEKHAFTATAALGLAHALQACGAVQEARPLVVEALKIRTEIMPAGAWQVVEASRPVESN